MPKYPIKLGRKMGACPSVSEPAKKGEKYYPSLYLDWEEKYDLPDSGTMTIKFRKTSETNTARPGEKEKQSVSLDILEILDTKAGKSKEDSEDETEEESGGEVLDRYRKEVESKKEEEEEEKE